MARQSVVDKCSDALRRDLFESRGPHCWKCGWGEVNTYSGTIPLVMNHIDGNGTNNSEENLELLCPNLIV